MGQNCRFVTTIIDNKEINFVSELLDINKAFHKVSNRRLEKSCRVRKFLSKIIKLKRGFTSTL